MNDPVESRKAKERSPSFPFISLEAALERARKFYDKEKRSSAPFAVAADHWGYSPASSGALQTAAALKNYGLMVDEGSGAGRKLKLTDLALRILLDTRPDDTERKQYMRQAALTPSVVADMYTKFQDVLPSETTINHYLVLELGFNQSTALRAVNIVSQNELLTKTSLKDNKSAYNENELNSHESSYPMEQQAISNPMMQPTGTKSVLVRTERVIDPDGIDVLLQFNGEPTLASYEFIKDYIDLRIKALKRTDTTAKKDKTEGS